MIARVSSEGRTAHARHAKLLYRMSLAWRPAHDAASMPWEAESRVLTLGSMSSPGAGLFERQCPGTCRVQCSPALLKDQARACRWTWTSSPARGQTARMRRQWSNSTAALHFQPWQRQVAALERAGQPARPASWFARREPATTESDTCWLCGVASTAPSGPGSSVREVV